MTKNKFSATARYEIYFYKYQLFLHGGAIDFSSSHCRLVKKQIRLTSGHKNEYYETLLNMLLDKVTECSFMETVESVKSYAYIDILIKNDEDFNCPITFFLTNNHTQSFTTLLQNPLLNIELTFQITDYELDEFKELLANRPEEAKILLEKMVNISFKKIES